MMRKPADVSACIFPPICRVRTGALDGAAAAGSSHTLNVCSEACQAVLSAIGYESSNVKNLISLVTQVLIELERNMPMLCFVT
jgi:hypothetical protein